jgi:hypothetical protein
MSRGPAGLASASSGQTHLVCWLIFLATLGADASGIFQRAPTAPGLFFAASQLLPAKGHVSIRPAVI